MNEHRAAATPETRITLLKICKRPCPHRIVDEALLGTCIHSHDAMHCSRPEPAPARPVRPATTTTARIVQLISGLDDITGDLNEANPTRRILEAIRPGLLAAHHVARGNPVSDSLDLLSENVKNLSKGMRRRR